MKPINKYGSVRECEEIAFSFPPQHQDRQPGFEYVMEPRPVSETSMFKRKLENKTAIITGGDSGIGRAAAYDFVKKAQTSSLSIMTKNTTHRKPRIESGS